MPSVQSVSQNKHDYIMPKQVLHCSLPQIISCLSTYTIGETIEIGNHTRVAGWKRPDTPSDVQTRASGQENRTTRMFTFISRNAHFHGCAAVV